MRYNAQKLDIFHRAPSYSVVVECHLSSLPGRVAQSDSRARSPGFGTRSEHILSFLLPLIQDEQLSVTGESMCTKCRGGGGGGGGAVEVRRF